MRSRVVMTAAGCALAGAMLLAQQNPMRPGRWEVTMQMQMAGMQMPPSKSVSCITAEQLKKDPASGLMTSPDGSSQNQCKMAGYKFAGDTATWKVVCEGQMPMTADGTMTLQQNDTYTGSIKMSTPQGEMTMQLAGKRLGDCT